MRQLKKEGWIHHLARHAVACFLTRGDLWISWEEGQKVRLFIQKFSLPPWFIRGRKVKPSTQRVIEIGQHLFFSNVHLCDSMPLFKRPRNPANSVDRKNPDQN